MSRPPRSRPRTQPPAAPPPRTNWSAWQRHINRYPTPADEVAAARDGVDTTVEFGDWSTLRHRTVIRADRAAVFEETVNPDLDLRDVIDTTWLNLRLHTGAGGARRDHWRTAISSALRRHAAALTRPPTSPPQHPPGLRPAPRPRPAPRTGATPIDIVESTDIGPADPGPPRFFLQSLTRADQVADWGDLAAQSPLEPWIAKAIGDARSDTFRGDVAAAGLPVVMCELCGVALTDAHPAWPGIWVNLGEYGPQCTGTCADRWGLSHPHIPRPSPLLGARTATGRAARPATPK